MLNRVYEKKTVHDKGHFKLQITDSNANKGNTEAAFKNCGSEHPLTLHFSTWNWPNVNVLA